MAKDVVEHDVAGSRFVIRLGDEDAELTYKRVGKRIVLIHTGVPHALEGQGLAAKLAHAALEFARANYLSVIPSCPYIATYLERHPEYKVLVRS